MYNIPTAIRAFVALDVPPTVKHALSRQIDVLRAAIPPRAVRWVAPDTYHLTLKFLGNIALQDIRAIQDALHATPLGAGDFMLEAQGLGCFPTVERPRVIWAGLQSDHVQALQAQVERTLLPLGHAAEKRRFHPHLTLGRINTTDARQQRIIGGHVQRIKAQAYGAWAVTQVVLMQSTLSPDGPTYTLLDQFPLSSNNPS